jgi:MFS transporter, ACS family, aldohexuronate transporter
MSARDVGRFRWAICALLFAACLVNYMDRQVLGLLKGELSAALHWSERDYGVITICFQASYALGQVLTGPLVEWIGLKTAYGGAMIFWSLAAAAHALTRSVVGFSGARLALGLGESANFPAAIRTVAEWFPPKERSIATGIFNTGSNVGSMIAPVLVPWLYLAFGWQMTFVLLGAAGLAWLVAWLVWFDPPEKSRRVRPAELAHIRDGVATNAGAAISWRRLLGYREAWAYYGTCVLVGPVWWFYGFWLPDFFGKQFHLDLKHFGPPLVVIAIVTCLGSIGGGGLSAWLLKRGWSLNRARKTTSLLCACCTLPVIFAPRVESMWLATAFFALAAAAHQGWSATMYTVVSDIFPRGAVGSVVGFGGTLASLVSLAFFWYVSNHLEGEGNYRDILLICGSAYVIAWTIFQLGVPRIKPVAIDSSPS